MSCENPETDRRRLCEDKSFSDRIGSLLDGDDSDITLIVEDVKVKVHRIILSCCSERFRKLFREDRNKRSKEMRLTDTSEKILKLFVTFAYTGRLVLTEPDDESVMNLLNFSFLYSVKSLQDALYDYFTRALTVNNVHKVYEKAILYGFDKLTDIALCFFNTNGGEILRSDSVLELSADDLRDMLMSNSLYAEENDVFYGVLRWHQKNQSDVPANKIQEILDQVRLPLIDINVLIGPVVDSNLFQPRALVGALRVHQKCSPTSRPGKRYLEIINENVASADYDAQVITGEDRHNFLKSDSMSLNGKGLAPVWHFIGDTTGITVKLNGPYLINYISFILECSNSVSYSYKIEKSLNGKTWDQIIDLTHTLCNGAQLLNVEPCVAQYIRVIGTYSTAGEIFCLTSFVMSWTPTITACLSENIVNHIQTDSIEMTQ